jgi:hypothetical protein
MVDAVPKDTKGKTLSVEFKFIIAESLKCRLAVEVLP